KYYMKKRGWFRSGKFVNQFFAVKNWVARKVVGAAVIPLPAVLGDDIEHGAPIVAVLGRIIVAQDFHFRNGVLIDGHAQFIRAAGLTGIQAVNGHYGRTAPLPGEVGQVIPETLSNGFNIIDVTSSTHNPLRRSHYASL